jgi:hypothetical protein
MAIPVLAALLGFGGGNSRGRIRIEGWRELQREISRAADKDLPKQIGRVHKDVGKLVISRLRPPSVGEGAGASVRPSATRREVTLRVGGGHRDEHVRQWGRRQLWPGGDAPERPDVLGTARRHEAEIMDALLKGVEKALKPPFK